MSPLTIEKNGTLKNTVESTKDIIAEYIAVKHGGKHMYESIADVVYNLMLPRGDEKEMGNGLYQMSCLIKKLIIASPQLEGESKLDPVEMECLVDLQKFFNEFDAHRAPAWVELEYFEIDQYPDGFSETNHEYFKKALAVAEFEKSIEKKAA
ncbi:hypothetical protein [Flavitalea sp.]|nr:hypothetical protein [Flavitalea sp.]